jgi:hypothetical protein
MRLRVEKLYNQYDRIWLSKSFTGTFVPTPITVNWRDFLVSYNEQILLNTSFGLNGNETTVISEQSISNVLEVLTSTSYLYNTILTPFLFSNHNTCTYCNILEYPKTSVSVTIIGFNYKKSTTCTDVTVYSIVLWLFGIEMIMEYAG